MFTKVVSVDIDPVDKARVRVIKEGATILDLDDDPLNGVVLDGCKLSRGPSFDLGVEGADRIIDYRGEYS